MNLDKIAAVLAACHRANEAILDAVEAAEDAGLSFNRTNGHDDVVAIEHAAKAARQSARRYAALGISIPRSAARSVGSN